MPFVEEGRRHVLRQGGGCISWVFAPTILIGVGLLFAFARNALSVMGVQHARPGVSGSQLAWFLAGGLVMTVFGLFGLTGRSLVVIDPEQKTLETHLRVAGFPVRVKRHAFDAFREVQLLTGRGRSTPSGPSHRFWFAAVRGPSAAVSLERSSYEEAKAQADLVARLLGVHVTGGDR